MKKSIAMSAVVAMLLMSGCSAQGKNETNNNTQNPTESLVYSNISDIQSQNKVTELLKANQIETEDIDKFNQSVQNYYKSIGDTPLFNEKEALKSELQLPYNVYQLAEVWEKNNPDIVDQNCRITSFRLFNDFIVSDSYLEENEKNTEVLGFDLNSIKYNPHAKFSDEDMKKFINLFRAISVTDSTNIEKTAEEIEKELKNRKISFVNPENISIISGYVPDGEYNTVFVGHTGIAFTTNEGVVFIEKFGFGLPYQVTKFKDKAELKKYMIDRLKIGSMGAVNTDESIIMENDKLM